MAKKIEQSLRRAVEQLPQPDVKALWEQPIVPMLEHDYMTRQDKIKKNFYVGRYATSLVTGMACMCLLFFGSIRWYGENMAINAVIGLDVNPSIEIAANKKDKVLSIKAWNDEGNQLLEGRNYKGWDVSDVVETLTISFQNKGYLDKINNAVLLTVNGKNLTHAEALAQELSGKIRMTADREETPTKVLRQIVAMDVKFQNQAKEYGVSVGKLQLAKKMTELLPQYDVITLLELPLETLVDAVELLGDDMPSGLTIDSSRFSNVTTDTNQVESDSQLEEIVPESTEPESMEPESSVAPTVSEPKPRTPKPTPPSTTVAPTPPKTTAPPPKPAESSTAPPATMAPTTAAPQPPAPVQQDDDDDDNDNDDDNNNDNDNDNDDNNDQDDDDD